MRCDGKTHNLKTIFSVDVSDSPEETEAVVRWCQDCGAVVVDKEVDGRLSPGGFVQMKFPSMTFPNAHKHR